MARERKNAPVGAGSRRRVRVGGPVIEGIRRRALAASSAIDLDEEELIALADSGIDPDDVQAVAQSPTDEGDVSIFDRTTPRDDLEGLIEGDDYA